VSFLLELSCFDRLQERGVATQIILMKPGAEQNNKIMHDSLAESRNGVNSVSINNFINMRCRLPDKEKISPKNNCILKCQEDENRQKVKV
jgi:hypothetical protein